MKTSVNQISRLTGHAGSVYALEHFDTGRFFSGSGDGIVALWEATNTGDGDAFFRAASGVYSLKIITGQHKMMAGNASGGVHIIDIESRKEEKLLMLHASYVFVICHNKKYQMIITGGGDGKIAVIDESFQFIKSMAVSTGKVRSIIFSDSENECIIGSSDGIITILSMPDLVVIKQWQAHEQGFGVNCLCLSPDGKFLMSGSRDARLNIYNLPSFDLMQSIPAHNYALYDIAFHHNRKVFATAGRDKAVKLWDADTYKVIEKLDKENHDGHNNSVNKIMWIGNLLISTGDDRSIIIWEVNNA